MHARIRIWTVGLRWATTKRVLAMLMLIASPAALVADTSTNDEADVVRITGRVVDPEGRPVSAAEITLFRSSGEPVGTSGESAPDGAFSVSFRKSSVVGDRPDLWKFVSVVANARGYAPAWAQVGQLEPGAEVELRLAEDDVPIQGRILTLDGRPIAGARFEVTAVSIPVNGSLYGFLREFRDRPVLNKWVKYGVENMSSLYPPFPSECDFEAELQTDQEGRFELHGIGRERLLMCEVKGEAIEATRFLVVSRPQIPPVPPRSRDAIGSLESPIPVYAASFNHFVGPSRPITGTVKAKDNGEPIAGARLTTYYNDVVCTAQTDSRGEFSLEGLPIEGEFRINVTPPEGQPYLPAGGSIVVTGALEKVQADFELIRGVLVKGRLINGQTQEPAYGYVEYLAYMDNRHYQALPGGFGSHRAMTTDDGRFELVVMPGPGALAAYGTYGEFRFAKAEEFDQPVGRQGMIATANRGNVLPRFFHRVVPINPEENSEPLSYTLGVRPAQQVTLKLVDSDGRPVVSGVLGCSLSGHAMEPVRGGSYDVPGLEPDETRTVIFVHRERNIGAGLAVSGADPGTQTVTLRPCATLAGRLVDTEGRPMTNALVFVWVEPMLGLSHTGTRTDVDGRFHMTGVVPGVTCRLLYRPKPGDTFELARLSLRSGEQRDLGDLDVSKAPRE